MNKLPHRLFNELCNVAFLNNRFTERDVILRLDVGVRWQVSPDDVLPVLERGRKEGICIPTTAERGGEQVWKSNIYGLPGRNDGEKSTSTYRGRKVLPGKLRAPAGEAAEGTAGGVGGVPQSDDSRDGEERAGHREAAKPAVTTRERDLFDELDVTV